MDKILRSKLVRKALALVLALVVGLTFVPLLGSNAYAADADQADDIAEAILDQTEAGDAEDVDVYLDKPSAKDAHAIDITKPEKAPKATDEGRLESIGQDAMLADISDAKDVYSMDVTRSGSIVTIKATVTKKYSSDLKFTDVMVDGSSVQTINNLSSVTVKVNMNNFDVNYHEIKLRAYSNALGQYFYTISTTQRTDITARPNYKGAFEWYSNYFVYAPYNMSYANRAYDLYMEYSADGGKTWKRSGYMRCNAITLAIDQQYKISGLLPNHNYVTRIRYGKYVNGKLLLGPVLGTGTYKTGAAKAPKIKSIKCKAVKVKRHKVKHYGYYTGVYLYTEKFYTYKVKVTVKLKKKPGTAGIWINGKFCKGNKKKYTATFTPYPNYSAKKPKGRKWGVVIASYQNKSYGGYSPLIQKKKKLK